MAGFNEAQSYDAAEQKAGGWIGEPLDIVDLSPEIIDRVMVDYAVERYQWLNYQVLASKVNSPGIKKVFIKNSVEEEDHLKGIESLLPFAMMGPSPGRDCSGSNSDNWHARKQIAGLENAATSLLAEFGQVEPETAVKDAFDHILLDHVAHAKALNDTFSYGLIESDPEPVSPIDNCRYDRWEGRPFRDQLTRTAGRIKKRHDHEELEPATKIRIYTMIAVEMALLNQFQSQSGKVTNQDLRDFYALVRGTEVDHIAMLNSLIDPFEPSLELAITGELVEIYSHKTSMLQAGSKRIKRSLYHAFNEDLEHLRALVDIADELGIIGIIERISADICAPVPELSADEYISQLMKTKFT